MLIRNYKQKRTGLIKLISYKWLVFFVITFLALLVRLHNLDHESLFMDEIHQVSYYKGTISEITNGAIGMQQPPLDSWVGAFF